MPRTRQPSTSPSSNRSAVRPDGERPPRVVVENVSPCIERGRFPIRRVVGEDVDVQADAYSDGHDALSVLLLWKPDSEAKWHELAMEPLGNDRWHARFRVERLEPHRYRVEAWVDHFRTWQRDLRKRRDAEAVERIDLAVGAELLAAAAARARGSEARRLTRWAQELREAEVSPALDRALSPELSSLMERHGERLDVARPEGELRVDVDRERARFSAWYELFPRSWGAKGQHGTLKDVEAALPYVAGMGFDVLYLPPIHPIGRVHRKGPNNNPKAKPGDLGSPWAIGSREGGHTALHPKLGTIRDFRRLVEKARSRGLEVALDLAFQCAPDHPWVKEHPQWFRQRPDGSIQYAENPPKKYQDIFPINFETEDWKALWEALLGVVSHWVDEGVRIFRVDNPHTKAFRFWEWMIAEVRREHPDVLFLAEAFTRPKVMYQLAKLGFSQSYTYFAWRNTKGEIFEYMKELTRTEVREFFRPSFWPNTPDILTEALQHGGRPVHMARLVLAATLSPSYGIYGPAFELMDSRPVREGSEEYLDSEKYQLRHWDLKSRGSLKDFITRINRLRLENPALQSNATLEFHDVDNEEMLAYSKSDPASGNVVLTVVNLDPHHTQSGWLELPIHDFGIEPDRPYQMHDLLSGARFLWHGRRNFVQIDPSRVPVHILRLRRKIRTEHDFDYFL
ncbi:MAG: alpha-1,4-glucan--maltose-1-phosphate maltosyltransferase [Acidobacteria bacterium]|nr:alpha-1,4-glucan--maltose-1-phosphate maltosyltransferase [Acidobacteriota bacterium]